MGNEVNNDAMDHDGMEHDAMEHDANTPSGRDHEGQGT